MIDSDSNKGLQCTACGSLRLRTVDTRPMGKMTRRAKKCNSCGTRFFTLELPETYLPDSETIDKLFER